MSRRFLRDPSRHPRNPPHRWNSNEPTEQSQELRRAMQEGDPARKLTADADFAEAEQDAAATHWATEAQLRTEAGK
jgi:hypothetical protein